MAFEEAGSELRDEYGIDRKTAQEILERYLRETLGEPYAQLQALHLEGGRWQARVTGSRKGVGTVFLQQHAGTVVGGHTSAGSGLVHDVMEASYRHVDEPDAEGPEQDSNQSIPLPAEELEEEVAAEPGQIHFQTLKWYHPTGHRSEPAGWGLPGGGTKES